MCITQFGTSKFIATQFMLAVAICFSFAGCSEKETTEKSDATAKLDSIDSATTTSVLPVKSDSETSPAESVVEIPSADAAPDVVCKRFMQLLQNGNRLTAEKLLTQTAFTVTSQIEWQIPPVGGNHAQFEMGKVQFATNQQNLAQVECQVIDTVDGKQESSEITWMLRRKKEGWRVFGMLLQLYEDKPKDLISFENPADVAMIKETLNNQHAGAEAELPATTETPAAEPRESVSQLERKNKAS